MKTKVVLSGCDDETVMEVDVTKEQFEFLQELAKKSEETSTYGCMPVMKLEVVES